MRYPTKTSTKEFCDTIATSIVRYEKYRYWASKTLLIFQVLLDAVPNAADTSAEDIQDVVDAVSNSVDVEEEGMMLDPDG